MRCLSLGECVHRLFSRKEEGASQADRMPGPPVREDHRHHPVPHHGLT